MQQPILILGGYGNFGKRIAAALVADGLPIILTGRDPVKAAAVRELIDSHLVEISCFDAVTELDDALNRLDPACVINTCGPFQNADYSIARTCIRHGVHYIDLADGRDFVGGISALDNDAAAAGISVISGASTVPGLSSAVIEHFQDRFAKIDTLVFGIAPGQRAERGLATTRGILSYVGKPLKPAGTRNKPSYGWQDIYRQDYPGLGRRWMANCDIPDMDLLPARYDIGDIRFSAGMEVGIVHLGLWGLSWIVRLGIPLNLPAWAEPLLSISNWFDSFGSADGGMHVILSGMTPNGAGLTLSWFIVAKSGDGPQIPTIPAIVLAKKIARGGFDKHGAMPCVGLVDLDT